MLRTRTALVTLLRLVLALCLAFSPLAQPMAIAALAGPEEMNACPHHARAGMHAAGMLDTQPGECCCKKGSPCHCAMTVALPTSVVASFPPVQSAHPVTVPRLAASVLPAPEPPPPRA